MKKAWPYLAALVLGVTLLLVAGGERGREKLRKRADDWLVGVRPQKDDGAVFNFAASIDVSSEKPVLTTGGERIELEWEGDGMAAKTQVAAVWTASWRYVATAAGLSSEDPFPDSVSISAFGYDAYISSIVNEQQGGVDGYRFEFVVDGGPTGECHDEAAFWTPEGIDVQFDGTIEVGPTPLKSYASKHPIGTKANVTHAKEMRGGDEWYTDAITDIAITFGPASCNTVGIPPFPLPSLKWTYDLGGHCSGTPGGADTWRIEDITMGEVALDCSGLDKVIPSSGGRSARVLGEGSTIRSYFLDPAGPGGNWFSNALVNTPRQYSFTGLAIRNMDGDLLPDLEVWCTGVQEYTAGAWHTVKHTLADWRALGPLSPDHGVYSWDAAPPEEGSIRLLADVAFYIDLDSARAHNLEGFQD